MSGVDALWWCRWSNSPSSIWVGGAAPQAIARFDTSKPTVLAPLNIFSIASPSHAHALAVTDAIVVDSKKCILKHNNL